jgi:small subunit ribosomal protein S8
MTTDTIADMLTRIRNSNLAKSKIDKVPATKITRSIARILQEEGLIESIKEELKNGFIVLILTLKYNEKENKPSIEHIQRVSKPGLRVYTGAKKMPRVLGGFGTAVVSTSNGLMTDYKARKEGIGGELLFYIW